MAYESILDRIANPKPQNYLQSFLGGVRPVPCSMTGRRDAGRQLAGQALTGDKAAGQQLAQVDPQVFMELRKFRAMSGPRSLSASAASTIARTRLRNGRLPWIT